MGGTARKSPIGSGQQDVGYSGVAAGRGVHRLSSLFNQWEGCPLIEVSLYLKGLNVDVEASMV